MEATRTDVHTNPDLAEVADVPVLVVVHHPDRGRLGARAVIAAGSGITLGRASDALGAGGFDHSSVSREHARVARSSEGLVVVDLESRNGTFVNGERVTKSALRFGDLISVGRVMLLVAERPALVPSLRSSSLLGVSSAIAKLQERIAAIGPRDATVLIRGETGVGKELIAEELHRSSGRSGDLVSLNCGALAPGVIQSEMFGHLGGAFSGASGTRRGLVARAAKGTLFLDEIGEASDALQTSLLRLLEQRQYRAVGSDEVQRTDARFVAATHVDLAAAVQSGRFRQDLFARLDRVVLVVPPLRERIEDVVPLALHFARVELGREVDLARHLVLALMRHAWPNNVRELRAVVEQALAEDPELVDDKLQLTAALRQRLTAPAQSVRAAGSVSRGRPEPDALRAQALACAGNVKALAGQLGVTRKTAYRWLAEAAIDLDALRAEAQGSSDE